MKKPLAVLPSPCHLVVVPVEHSGRHLRTARCLRLPIFEERVAEGMVMAFVEVAEHSPARGMGGLRALFWARIIEI